MRLQRLLRRRGSTALTRMSRFNRGGYAFPSERSRGRVRNEVMKRRASTWVCVLINQLAFPGMGTVMAGHRCGYIQATLMVAGFCLVMGFMLWFLLCTGRYLAGAPWTEEQFAAQYRPYAWMWKVGVLLCLVSWFWALVSSLELLRRHKPGSSKDRMATSPAPKPPPLPPVGS